MSLWDDKKYVDLWSIVHFMSGVLLYGIFWWLEWNFFPAFLTSVALIILWEVFEYLIKIIERSLNVAIDIVLGILGFFLPILLDQISLELDLSSYMYASLFTAVLALIGFVKFLNRKRYFAIIER